MQFTPSNREDIKKYYQGCYVKFKEHVAEKNLPPDTLFFIENVDYNKVTGKCETGDSFVIWLSNEHPFEVDYVLPHKSFFQKGQYAMLLERIPAKQYFRGVNPENTQMTYLTGNTSTPKKGSIDFQNLKVFVTKQKFYTLAEAMETTNISSVLGPRMQYLGANHGIYMDHVLVAKVNKKLRKIYMIRPIFQQEILDMLRENGEHMGWLLSEKKELAELEPTL